VLTYENQAQLDLETHFKASAHEVRAIATSMLVWKNVSILDIMKAAFWRSHSIFTDFYLRDMSSVSRVIERDGDGVVCAGRIITLDL